MHTGELETVPRLSSGELSWPAFIAVGVVVLGVVAAIAYFLLRTTDISLRSTGQLVASGGSDRSFVIDGGTCMTGERRDFDGVRISGEKGGSILLSPGAERSTVRPPKCKSADCEIVLDRDRCERFDASLEMTGNLYNGRYIWTGSLGLRCQQDGLTIEADIQFPTCA